MPSASYLQRRGPIYYWRRRLPRSAADRRKARHVMLSLRTPILARARLLAAHLNVVAEELFRSVPMLSEQQLNDVFRSTLQRQLNKLGNLVAAEAARPGFDWRESVRMDERWYWTYRLLAARGPGAQLDDSFAAQMRSAGVSEQDIYCVAQQVQVLRAQQMVPPRCADWKRSSATWAPIRPRPISAPRNRLIFARCRRRQG